MSKVEGHVSGLHEYPIKSCAGLDYTTEGDSLPVTETAFPNDRLRVVITPEGDFLSQRDHPKMALIKPQVQREALIVTAEGESSELVLPLYPEDNGIVHELVIWGSDLEGVDDGDLAADWFSDFLGVEARLVHMSSDFARAKKGAKLRYADSYPLLIASEESLADLNERIRDNGGEPVDMSRFRPNIVVRGVRPYREDEWAEIQINDVGITVVKPCIRCPIPQVNQRTGVKGKEPIKSLLGYRRINRKEVIFAQKAVHRDQGEISVGDEVVVYEYKDLPEVY